MAKRKYVFSINYDEKFVLAENKEEALNIIHDRYPYEHIIEDLVKFSPRAEDYENAAKDLFNDKDTFIKDFAKDSWDAIYHSVVAYKVKEFKYNPYMDLWQYNEITVSELIEYLSGKKDSLSKEQKEFVNYILPLANPSFFYSGELGKPQVSPEEDKKNPLYLFTLYCKEFNKKTLFKKGSAKFVIYSISSVLKDLIKNLNDFANEAGYAIEAFIGGVSYSKSLDIRVQQGWLLEYEGLLHDPKSDRCFRTPLKIDEEIILNINSRDVTEETQPELELIIKVNEK